MTKSEKEGFSVQSERKKRERKKREKKKRERKKREINCFQRSRERSATVGEREMEIDSERETG